MKLTDSLLAQFFEEHELMSPCEREGVMQAIFDYEDNGILSIIGSFTTNPYAVDILPYDVYNRGYANFVEFIEKHQTIQKKHQKTIEDLKPVLSQIRSGRGFGNAIGGLYAS